MRLKQASPIIKVSQQNGILLNLQKRLYAIPEMNTCPTLSLQYSRITEQSMGSLVLFLPMVQLALLRQGRSITARFGMQASAHPTYSIRTGKYLHSAG